MKNEIITKSNTISRKSKPYIVAEIGLNHNNDIEIGKRTIQAAKKAGVDAVKFQSYITEDFIDANNPEATFLFDIFKKYELNESSHKTLQKTANEEGIEFFSTPLDLKSVDLLVSLKVPFIKIASGDIVNKLLLTKVAETNIPIFLSTGAADFFEVTRAVEFLESKKVQELVLFHCVSLYPTPKEKLNIKTLELYSEIYTLPLGFSDHSEGFLGAVLSLGFGTTVFEKHFTLNKKLDGPDHKISADPSELKEYVSSIHSAFEMLGEKKKILTENESQGRYYGRRSIYKVNSEILALRPALHTKSSSYIDSWDIEIAIEKKAQIPQGGVKKL
ncbi:MAG: N-acetylneuraminate synthase family protein [Leptospiraceae bacterium]|nr:N-acetylneuraminate synthase family protein [Leptospiraceae bacterium]